MGPQTNPSSSACLPVLSVRTAMHDGRAVVLAPHGEIDRGSVSLLDRALTALPEEIVGVVLNMAEVTFMDSAGLHFLDRLHTFGEQRGVPVEAVHFGRQPGRVMEADGSRPCSDAEHPTEHPVSARTLHLLPDLHAPASEETAPTGADTETARLCEELDQLRQALTSRPLIDQALGMIMALGPCSGQQAWGRLVRVSQRTNTKLRDVAAALVATADDRPLPEALRKELGGAFDHPRVPADSLSS